MIEARTASSCKLANLNLEPRPHPTLEGSQRRGSDKGRKNRKDRGRKDHKKSRSSTKGSKGPRKGSKGSKGSGNGKRSSASTAAAVCLLGAVLAGAAPQADDITFRKELSCQNSLRHPVTNLALPAISFHETHVPIRDPSCNLTAVREPKRRYSREFPVNFRPNTSDVNL